MRFIGDRFKFTSTKLRYDGALELDSGVAVNWKVLSVVSVMLMALDSNGNHQGLVPRTEGYFQVRSAC